MEKILRYTMSSTTDYNLLSTVNELYNSSPFEGLTRSPSIKTEMSVYNPQLSSKRILRSVTKEIEAHGITSCQLTRTIGLIVYSLQYVNYRYSEDSDIVSKILCLLYPYPYEGLRIVPLRTPNQPANQEKLVYLKKCLNFNSVREFYNYQYRVFSYYYKDFFKDDNNYFNILRTFAIINSSDVTFPYCPIHYFNISRSQTLNNQITCYTSWASDTINVKWDRIPIKFEHLMDMQNLLSNIMILPNNLIQGTSIEEKAQIASSYIRSLLNNNLFIIELLNIDGSAPLIADMNNILSDSLNQNGGTSQNSKRRQTKNNAKKKNKKKSNTKKRKTKKNMKNTKKKK